MPSIRFFLPLLLLLSYTPAAALAQQTHATLRAACNQGVALGVGTLVNLELLQPRDLVDLRREVSAATCDTVRAADIDTLRAQLNPSIVESSFSHIGAKMTGQSLKLDPQRMDEYLDAFSALYFRRSRFDAAAQDRYLAYLERKDAGGSFDEERFVSLCESGARDAHGLPGTRELPAMTPEEINEHCRTSINEALRSREFAGFYADGSERGARACMQGALLFWGFWAEHPTSAQEAQMWSICDKASMAQG